MAWKLLTIINCEVKSNLTSWQFELNYPYKNNHQNLKIKNNLIKNIIFHHELDFIYADINGSYNILRKFYQSIGIRFNLEPLIKNIERINNHSHFKSNITNVNNIKLQNRLFQPCMVDLQFIETYYQGLNLSKNKLKVLEEVRNKDKTQSWYSLYNF